MDELKTLKDIGINPALCSNLPMFARNELKKMLKQEAIKWIKYGYKQLMELDKIEDRNNIRGGIESFKQFFNITEEDLK